MPKSFILRILFNSQSWKLEVRHHAQHPCKEGRNFVCVSKDQAARLPPRVHNFCNGMQSATTLCCCHKYSYCFFCIICQRSSRCTKKNKNNKCHASSSSSSSGNCFWYYKLVHNNQKQKQNESALRTCTKADSLLHWFFHPCCHIFLMRVKTCCSMFFSVIRGYLILSIMFFQALFVGCMRKWNACSSRHFIPFCKTPTPAGIPCF